MKNQSLPIAPATHSLTVAYTHIQDIPAPDATVNSFITFWDDRVPHLQETVQKPDTWDAEWFANYE